MSLVIDAKTARGLGAKYEDGTRPFVPPKPQPDETAQALLALAQAIKASIKPTDTSQHDALVAILNSNKEFARAVINAITAEKPVEPQAEEWSFEHVYDFNGNLTKTIARRVR